MGSYSVSAIQVKHPLFNVLYVGSQVASDLAGALVYLDEGAGEAAHFSLGLRYLLGLGVVNVCSLKDAKTSDAGSALITGDGGKAPPLAIFLTTCLNEAHRTHQYSWSYSFRQISPVLIFLSV
eukprot:4966558-Pyramimonas_sp.AAC.1